MTNWDRFFVGNWVPAAFCATIGTGVLVTSIHLAQANRAMTLAKSQLDRGMTVLAVDTLEPERHSIASHASGCKLLVSAYSQANRTDLLEWAAQACLDKGVGTLDVYLGLANVNAATGRQPQAIQILEASIKRFEHAPEPWVAAARIFRQAKRNDEAQGAYFKALERVSETSDAQLYFEALQFLASIDRWKQALPIANRLKAAKSDNPEALLLIARVLSRGGDRDQAAPLVAAAHEQLAKAAPEARTTLEAAYKDVLGGETARRPASD